jgi:4-hydroxymandelate oxidase
VLIGRPYLFGLAHAGAHGVAHVVRLLRNKLKIAMALTGRRTLADVSRMDLLHPATGNFIIDSNQ